MARQLPWSTEAHAFWPPAFKAAVRALLLSAHRLAREEAGGGRLSRAQRVARRAGLGGGGATLAALPSDLLVAIAAQAALPMSQWM